MILESTRDHQVTVFGLDSYLTFSFLGCQAVGCTYQGNIIPNFKKKGIEKNISMSFIKIIFLSDFFFVITALRLCTCQYGRKIVQ